MVNKNNPVGSKKYQVRVYNPRGTLAQESFIHKFDKILSPGNVINLPRGIYDGKYRVAAIGPRKNHEDLTSKEIEELISVSGKKDPRKMDLKSWQVEYEWHYLMQYGAAEEKIRKNSDWTLKNIPSGCSRGIRADWHYYDHDSLEKGIRANLFVFPTRYQESIQDAYFGSFGYILNSNPKIRKHLKNMELVTEFNRDYIKKGLTNKFVDLIGKKLEQDIKTKGGRNFTKKVIAAGLIGVISLGYFGVKKIKGTINNQPPNQKLERVFNLDKEIK